MKKSHISVQEISFPTVVVRSNPKFKREGELAPASAEIKTVVVFEDDGDHIAMMKLTAEVDGNPFGFEIDAFVMFSINSEIGQKMFGPAFEPSAVGVNLATLLYGASRELFASITARTPHGFQVLESVVFERKDVGISFEKDKRESILKRYFLFSDEQIESSSEAQKAKARKNKSVAKKRVGKAK